MRAFWWFKDDSIAGMGRPGFNSIHWYDLPFDEAVVMGWIGQHSSGSISLSSFRDHLRSYAPKIFKFYKLDSESGTQAIRLLTDSSAMLNVVDRFAKRSRSLKLFDISNDHLHFETSEEQLDREATFLKNLGIQRIVSLTEHHHNKESLQNHFDLTHIGIEDLGAPQVDQAQKLAELIIEARARSEKLAVHCLAGIGRTSTMLIAAHLLMGEGFEALKTLIAKQNPSYGFSGPQGEFLNKLSQNTVAIRG